ncbi:hypothetical protein GUJ93_ZPchr0009g80 [Zizania palustris]|uniref:Uncharacterized protein n=1 Tax=Zizania palustris TaxID=103762 RepID=A0A8J5V4J9_ZIZPA|nr:hypothetical protein GUJ93_ZPchr0009g80 [Zizania palustris]
MAAGRHDTRAIYLSRSERRDISVSNSVLMAQGLMFASCETLLRPYAQPVLTVDSPPSSSQPQGSLNDRWNNGDNFPSEHDEVVMLEAAMLGGISEGHTYPLSIPSHRSSTLYPRVEHAPSPALTEQRLLREQQDHEYLASLQADEEK